MDVSNTDGKHNYMCTCFITAGPMAPTQKMAYITYKIHYQTLTTRNPVKIMLAKSISPNIGRSPIIA